ncbi:hypothetical protein [Hymenobacter sp. ISL-91]|uniref:hypothetical protein n=1 Tax=Hymenobacter sp. ISL-91 TaxID=2819151 RepID=UPI001BE77524|nr:hypothetical protein [Hymenobacter sp. ISL-91]
MQRTAGTPRAFRVDAVFRLAGELRLAWPIASDWALETTIGITELQPGISYQLRSASSSAGFGMGPLLQTGLSVRRLDLLMLGSRLSLDASLGAAGARLVRSSPVDNVHDFFDQRQSAPNQLVVIYRSHSLHRNTILLNGDLRLRYELAANHHLLLSLGYAQGLRPLLELRTQQLLYPDANGTLRQGGFAVRERGSNIALQLGYGWLLGRTGERATPHTPRYGSAPQQSEALTEAQEAPALSEPPTDDTQPD